MSHILPLRHSAYACALLLIAGLALSAGGCPGDPPAPSVKQLVEAGGICGENTDCASQLCRDGLCVIPNVPPVADPGPNRVTLAGLGIGLDASASQDPDAHDGDLPLSFDWVIVSAPAEATASLSDPASAAPTFTADVPGVYQLELLATDEDGGVGTATTAVFVLDQDGAFKLPDGAPCASSAQCAGGKCEDGVCQPNFQPTADAGVSQTVVLGEVVTLDGSKSNDPDSDPLEFSWTLAQLPEGASASLVTADTVTTEFTPDVIGLYVVRLQVNDGWLGSSPHVVATMVVVDGGELRPDGAVCDKDEECESQFCFDGSCKTNEAPVAIAGTGVIVQVGTEVTIDAGESTDPEGLALSYAWAVNDVTPTNAADASSAGVADPTLAATTFTPDIPGVFVLRLVVADGMLESLPDDLIIYADADPVNLLPNGEPCVADLACESGFCSASSCATNSAPIADAGPNQNVLLGLTVALDGSGSSDPEAATLSYDWTIAEAPDASTATLSDPAAAGPTFLPNVTGAYVLSLVVDDGDLSSVPSTTLVVVGDGETGPLPNGSPCTLDGECISLYCAASGLCATNTLPVADIQGPTSFVVDMPVPLDGSASDDADGHELTFAWTIHQAPDTSTASLDDEAGLTPFFTPDVAGVYIVGLIVNDGYVDSSPVFLVLSSIDPGLLPDGSPCTLDGDCVSGFCYVGSCETNAAPTAVIAGPTSVQAGTPVAFDGATSSDPENQTLSYTWNVISVPNGSSAALANGNQAVANLPTDVAGSYVVGLTVNDGYLDSTLVVAVVVATPSPGTLPEGDPCTSNIQCASQFCGPDGTCQCVPETCQMLGANCGQLDNGCSDIIDCGTCGTGEVCGGSNLCECEPQDCAAQGFSCGSWDDTCGNTIVCGICNSVPSGLGTNSCVSGACEMVCDAGAEACGANCIDPMTDAANCGGCGVEDCVAAACIAGACETLYTLSIVSGDGQTVGLGQPTPAGMPLRVRVTDGLGANVIGATLSVTASPGAHVAPASATTLADGAASFQIWSGTQDGAYTFSIDSGPDATPLTATLNAEAVPLRVYPVTNYTHQLKYNTYGNTPGPSTQVQHSKIAAGGLAVATDGTIYMSAQSQHAILKISPTGAATLFAGTSGFQGDDGDFGPALSARFAEPRGVALDEALQRLYIVDGDNKRIRYVDLVDGNIYPFAGGGVAGGSDGDGGSALAAYFSAPRRVNVSPNGDVYVSDWNRIRVISGGTVQHFIGAAYDEVPSGCFSATDLTISGCGGGSYGYSCDMVWAPDGSVLVSAEICGQAGSPNTAFNGILRLASDGSRSLVAGSTSGGTTDGLAATAFRFAGWVTGMAMDPAGNVFVANHQYNGTVFDGVRRIDGRTGLVTTVVGGAQGDSGLWGPALSAQFDAIVAVRFDPAGNLLLASNENHAVLGIGGLEETTPSSVSLVASAGEGETHRLADLMAPQPAAQLLDGGGQPIIGAPITFTTNHPGVHPQEVVVATTFPGSAASFTGRMGLGFDPVAVYAEYRDLLGNHVDGSPVSYTLGVSPPDDGMVFTAVNIGKVNGAFEAGPSTNVKLDRPISSCTGPDGSIYTADTFHHRVLRITPKGDTVVLAGNGTPGYSGDGGVATAAQLNDPTDVGLDVANGILYIADSDNEAIRGVDLASGIIFLFAGRGSQTAAPHGDNGHRLDATFINLTRLAVAADGSAVYSTETGATAATRFRRIDGATGQVQPLLYQSNPGCNAAPVSIQSCETDYCAIDVGPGPNYSLYFAGNMCGTDFGSGWVGGVAKYDPTAAVWSAVTGPTTAASGDGMPAASTLFTWAQTRDAAVGSDGTIYVAEGVENVIRRIDGATSIVTTIAGISGSTGSSGEFVPGTSALFDNPRAVAVHPDGHVVVTDQSASAVRIIWRSCAVDADCATTGHCNTVTGACTIP